MLIQNLRLTVQEILEGEIALTTEQGQRILIPRHLLPPVAAGDVVFLAMDTKPLVSADQHAKDILNEIIKDE